MEKLLGRVKNILLSPKSEWEVIKSETSSVKDIIFNYVVILAAIPVVASIIGKGIVGFSFMGATMRYPLSYLLLWGLLGYVMSIIGIVVAGAVINTMAPTFESRKDNAQALKVAAYAYTPVWIVGILNIIPMLGLIVLLASLYGIYVLYLGLAPLMETPESKALGYTVVTIIAMIAIAIIINVLVSVIAGIFIFSGGHGMSPMMGH